MTLYHIFPNTSKNTKHIHISLTGTEIYNSRLSETILLEKDNILFWALVEILEFQNQITT